MQQDMHSGVEEDREWIEGWKRDTESEREREREGMLGEGVERTSCEIGDRRQSRAHNTHHSGCWLH